MTWRIMEQLPRFASRPEFATIANYIGNDNRGLRRYELAQRIAHVFDEYVIFRAKMILDWDAGAENNWQSILWRELRRAAPGQHQATLGLQLIDALKRGDDSLRRFAPRFIASTAVSTEPYAVKSFPHPP